MGLDLSTVLLRRLCLAVATLASALALGWAGVANAQVLPFSTMQWSKDGDWQFYYVESLGQACFGEAHRDGTMLLIGQAGDTGALFLGFASEATAKLEADSSYEVSLDFDTGDKWSGGTKSFKFPGWTVLLASYLEVAADLRRDIAAASTLTMRRDGEDLAILSLKGTSAAFKTIDACVKAKGVNAETAAAWDAEKPLTDAQREKAVRAHGFNLDAADRFEERRFAEAAELSQRALTLFEEVYGTENSEVAGALHSLAASVNELGDTARAEQLYRRALAMREKVLGPDHVDVADTLMNLATLLVDKREFDEADALYRRSIAVYEKTKGPDDQKVAAALLNLGRLVWGRSGRDDTEQLNEAEEIIRRSIAISEKNLGPRHAEVANALNNLAIIHEKRGELTRAEGLLKQALEILETELGTDHPDYLRVLNNLADIAAKGGNPAAGIKRARAAAAAGGADRETYLSILSSMGKDFAGEAFEVTQSVSDSASGQALQSLAARFATGNSSLSVLIREEQDSALELKRLEAAILDQVSRPPEERDGAREAALRSEIEGLRTQLQAVRDELQQKFPDYAELSRPKPLALADTQALLDPDEALIVLDLAKRGRGLDFVWVVTRDEVRWEQVPDGGLGPVFEMLAGFIREDIEAINFERGYPDLVSHGNALYDTILKPVEASFIKKKHLLFVLNGPMSALPPQLLVTSDPQGKEFADVDWLIKRHAISVLPSVGSLALLRNAEQRPQAPLPMIGFADADYEGVNCAARNVAAGDYGSVFSGGQVNVDALRELLCPLPATATEIVSVGASVGATAGSIHTQRDASEATVKTADLEDYRIVYFATHGLVAGEVERFVDTGAEPALAFTIPKTATALDDGLLTASEIAQLELNADWVVLSACNTAGSNEVGADALAGLARSFFFAGARSLLVTHWPVDDAAAAQLMIRTFDNAKKNPRARGAEALRQAMLSVMNDPAHPEWAHPFYWAPYILVGQPSLDDRVAPAETDKPSQRVRTKS